MAEKLKIRETSSESYPGGRIDSFGISLHEESPHNKVINILRDLGFPRDELEKVDVIFQETDYIFVYGSPKIKAHINIEKDKFFLRFDTSIEKEKVNRVMEKYCYFPV